MKRKYTPIQVAAFLVVICLIVGIRHFLGSDSTTAPDFSAPTRSAQPTATEDGELLQAIRSRRSEVMVQSSGMIAKVLPDDEEGSRHQRLIVRLDSGDTVLIAHNIDLAPRVPVAHGERIQFKGQYEWNEKGGVVHWTHHDPQRRHPGGWLQHEGRKYD